MGHPSHTDPRGAMTREPGYPPGLCQGLPPCWTQALFHLSRCLAASTSLHSTVAPASFWKLPEHNTSLPRAPARDASCTPPQALTHVLETEKDPDSPTLLLTAGAGKEKNLGSPHLTVLLPSCYSPMDTCRHPKGHSAQTLWETPPLEEERPWSVK